VKKLKMIIDSKFKDYYDVVASQGVDKSIVYNRVQEFNTGFPEKESLLFSLGGNRRWGRFYGAEIAHQHFLVLFCGKAYFGVQFSGFVKGNYDSWIEYDHEKIISRIAEAEPMPRKKYMEKYTTVEVCKKVLENVNRLNVSIDYFRKYKAPVIIEVYNHNSRQLIQITNPKLKNYRFERVVDPYTAFQEIQMFISGVLGQGNTMKELPISDKLRAESKGFNDLSFRRQEHQRKRKKNA